MIITEAEARVVLGIESSATDTERALLTLLVPVACNRVKQYLEYDPEQAELTEIYPRHNVGGGVQIPSQSGQWRVNPAHTRAMFEDSNRSRDTLQLERLPVRSVSEVLVDTTANHGQADGAFSDSTEWEQGSDFWVEWDRTYSGSTTIGLCGTGCLISYGSWPTEIGTVRVKYRAGYSPEELAGRAVSDATNDSVVTMNRVDASGIKRAALLTVTRAFHEAIAFRKHSRVGFVPGSLTSENMGDYSYQVAGGAGVTDMTVSLPPEAAEELDEYRNYGVLRL